MNSIKAEALGELPSGAPQEMGTALVDTSGDAELHGHEPDDVLAGSLETAGGKETQQSPQALPQPPQKVTQESLQIMEQKMLKTHTQTQQQLQAERKETLGARDAYEQKLQELTVASQQGSQVQEEVPTSFSSMIQPETLAAMSPEERSNAAATVQALDTILENRDAKLSRAMQNTDEQAQRIQQLEQSLTNMQTANTANIVTQRMSETQQRYGGQAEQHAQSLQALYAQAPGMTPDQAMMIVDPQGTMARFQALGAQQANQTLQQDAHLAGMEPSPGAPATQQPFVAGESMEESAKHAAGINIG